MTILLLGSTGYLGRNMAGRFMEDGNKVICVVRKNSDTEYLSKKKVQFISDDPVQIEVTLKHEKIDWIINSACTYEINDSMYGDMLESNIIFPLRVLNLAVKYHVANFLTIGTSLPDSLNFYSFSKQKFAEFGNCFSNEINFCNLKLEMFYGGLYEPENRFFCHCKKKLLCNDDVCLTSGEQKRDIIRLEDVLGIIKALINCSYVSGFKSLQAGSGEQHSIYEMLTYMKACVKSNSRLLFGNIKKRENEPDTLADISWMNEIGYRLKYTFWDGLDDYMKSG